MPRWKEPGSGACPATRFRPIAKARAEAYAYTGGIPAGTVLRPRVIVDLPEPGRRHLACGARSPSRILTRFSTSGPLLRLFGGSRSARSRSRRVRPCAASSAPESRYESIHRHEPHEPLVVLAFALLVAGGASLFVLAPCSASRCARSRSAATTWRWPPEALPVGTMLAPADVKLVAWPSASPVAGGFSKVEDVVNRGLIAPVVENEPLTIVQGGAARSRRRPAADDHAGHARHLGEGERSDRRRRLRGARHAGRRGRHDQPSSSRACRASWSATCRCSPRAPRSTRSQRARTASRCRATVVTAAGHAGGRRAHLAGRVGRADHADAAQSARRAPSRRPRARGWPRCWAPRIRRRPRQRRRRGVAASRRRAAPPAPAPAPSIYTVETIRAAKRTAEVVQMSVVQRRPAHRGGVLLAMRRRRRWRGAARAGRSRRANRWSASCSRPAARRC